MSVERCSGLRFANELPHFVSFDQEFKFADRFGRERSLPLNKLEKYLSPTLLILPGRPGVITPIQRAYADDLFGSSPQLSLLPLKEAVLFSERVYFSSSRNRSEMKPGTVLIFYESGKDDGRSAAIAVARVVATEIVEKKSISATLLRRGVVQASKIAELSSTGHIAVTKFDNVLILPTAVPLSTLRMLGCADGANLVTARTVSTDQTIAVMEVGFSDLMMHSQEEDILISVRAKYVRKMLTGEKTVELRRRHLHVLPGTRVWIYTTAPNSVVEAFAFIDQVVSASPKYLWRKYRECSGVAQNEFSDYFYNVEVGCALVLRDLTRLGNRANVLLTSERPTENFDRCDFYLRLCGKDPRLQLLKQSTKK